jgi:ribosomal protein S4E
MKLKNSMSILCSYFADVVTIEKTGEFFRLIYDVKGRFTIHRITAEEAKVNHG